MAIFQALRHLGGGETCGQHDLHEITEKTPVLTLPEEGGRRAPACALSLRLDKNTPNRTSLLAEAED